jgi:LysR family transcriptional regulator of gallate degradation
VTRQNPPDLSGQLGNLRTFLQVAQAKSMADAGRVLFKSPTVVSRTMCELEYVLGGTLFERTSRGVMLNDRGRTVLARVQRIDQELSQAAAEVARLRPQAPAQPDALREPLYDGKRLSVITYLVDRGTVSLAAGALGMTQSGVSMALSRTEAALGVQLFTRSSHGLVPLPATCRIVVHAKRAFAELRHLSSDLASAGGQVTGVVSIGTLPLGRTQVVPTAIDEATTLHPALRITTVENHYEQLIGGLQSGEVDVIVGVPRGEGAGLQIEYLLDDRLAILARSGHPLQSASSIALADIAGARWILPRKLSRSRRLLMEAFEQKRLTPPVPVVESADLAIVRYLLLAGDALALASVRQFSFELAADLLTELPVALPGMSRPVALILRHGAAPSVAVRAIVDALRHQAAAELAAVGGNREPVRRETSAPDVLSGDSALRRGDGVETPGSRTPTVVDGVISATVVATSAR